MAFNLNTTIKHTQEADGFVKLVDRLTKYWPGHTYNWGKFEHNWRTVLLIMCGTNHVAVNKADKLLKGIDITLKTVIEPQVSVVLVNLPNRQHFAHWLCLNREIEKTDLELKNLSEKFSNVTVRPARWSDIYILARVCIWTWVGRKGNISEKFSNVTCGGQYNRATYTYSPGKFVINS